MSVAPSPASAPPSRIPPSRVSAPVSGNAGSRSRGAAASLAGGGGSSLLDDLRRSTGLDNLDVTTDSTGQTAVTAGRYITDKVYLGVQAGAAGNNRVTVNLDLAPVIDRAKQALVADGVVVAERIPEIHTSYVLVKSDQVDDVRTLVRLLSLAGYWVPVLAAYVVPGVRPTVGAFSRASASCRWACLACGLGPGAASAVPGVPRTARVARDRPSASADRPVRDPGVRRMGDDSSGPRPRLSERCAARRICRRPRSSP